jgi:hypothetical protein
MLMPRAGKKRCRRCDRTGQEFYRKACGKDGFDTICKRCKITEAVDRKKLATKREQAIQRSERRRMVNQIRNRMLITDVNLLDTVDRSERRSELAWIGGLKGVHGFKARIAAARSVKVAARGREIPLTVLDQILPA